MTLYYDFALIFTVIINLSFYCHKNKYASKQINMNITKNVLTKNHQELLVILYEALAKHIQKYVKNTLKNIYDK